MDNVITQTQTPKSLRSDLALTDLIRMLAEFARERNWQSPQPQKPSISSGITFFSLEYCFYLYVGEVGELSEIFQWRGEVPTGLSDWSADEKEHLEEKLSDVLLYLVRLADVCNVNLGEAALEKLRKNASKYPVDATKRVMVVR
ncbi:hypothetical protein KP509_32G053600 [Ceratopteris richardii]|uniref:dCTP pyrophosphatase 1 n=1 Tax=Ceratopteris richardii TaxID=49495 RepID=A0A8T2QU05_CERRI|nr:hypothetical protein KP509_32G053600 [Ceratopteris richardii]